MDKARENNKMTEYKIPGSNMSETACIFDRINGHDEYAYG